MSIARVAYITKSQKQYKCEKCGAEIAKGQPYRRFKVGFRSNFNHYRCMKSECTPTRGQLDNSKMSSVWDAQDEFERALNDATSRDDIMEALSTYAEALREVGSEYTEASINPNTGAVFSTDNEERGETLDQAADEVENIDIEELDIEAEDCDECDGTGEQPCADCDGSGQVETGEHDEDDEDVMETCGTCNGDGTVDCSRSICDGGQVAVSAEATEERLNEMRDAAREALEVELP